MLAKLNQNFCVILRLAPRLPRARVSLLVLAASGVLVCTPTLAERVPVGALPNVVNGVVSQPGVVSGQFGSYTVSGKAGRIRQLDPVGILNWDRFDIGQGASMTFEQPSSSAVVLNRVNGGAYLNQTVIEGALKANGQVYIYNPNGVIIGRSGQVDVNTLLATTLNIDNSRFLRGLLSPYDSTAQLIIDPAFRNNPGSILVEGNVVARSGGRIILVAPQINNDGSLVSENGQVILAAGRQVFLSSSDSNMRGLLVEVNNSDLSDNLTNQTHRSTVTNTANGRISVGEGNATLVGYAVNQMGLVSAETSVDNNGSIWLLARDGAAYDMPTKAGLAHRGGELTLGGSSRNEITLKEKLDSVKKTSRTLADSDRTLDKPSQVLLSGETIRLESGSTISARGGNVDIRAQSNPANYNATTKAAERDADSTSASVEIASGVSIDVSGSRDTQLSMESLSMAVELRGSQLADSPVLRNGPLKGQTVYVDARKGTAIANLAGDMALREYSLGELTARGGTVKIFADGAARVASGASVDVSGGWVDYQSGRVVTSKLRLPSGKLVDIGKAQKGVVYTGVVNSSSISRRGIEPGYREGFSAGSLSVDATSVLLAGKLNGQVVRGPLQRDPSAANWPVGASLIIGDIVKAFNSETANPNLPLEDAASYGYRGNVVLGKAAKDNDAEDTLNLDSAALVASGFEHFDIAAGGNVSTQADIALPVAASLKVAALGTVNLDHSLTASGGTLKVAAQSVTVKDGVSIDLAGRWVNDLPVSISRGGGARDSSGHLQEVLAINGGTVSLQALGKVDIGAAAFDVSGGAQLTASGKLVSGSAGSITLTTPNVAPGDASGLALASGVKFTGYGLSSGGSLKLQGRDAYLGGDSPFSGSGQVAGADARYDLWLSDDFFQQGGFSAYEIGAAVNATIRSGAAIAPRQANWLLSRDYRSQASGSMKFADIAVLPLAGSGAQANRPASNLTVTATAKNSTTAGRLVMETGSSITTDPGGQVTLKAERQLTVDGSIAAPAGKIALELTKDSPSPGEIYLPERSIWVGEHARLSALGSSARMRVDADGVASGEVLDGGSISITGKNGASAVGHVVVAEGALLDVSGTQGSFALKNDPLHPVVVASNGGSIDIRARESLYFNGTAKGASGGGTASGGSFSAVLDRESTGTIPAGYPGAELDLALLSAAGSLPAGLAANASLDALAGKGQVAAPMLQAGGFDTISLKSQGRISLDLAGGTQFALAPRRSLTLDAPLIATRHAAAGASVSLSADYLNLGNSDVLYQTAHTATWGDASLNLRGTMVDLVGDLALQGFRQTNIVADEAVRLVGVGAELATEGNANKATTVNLKGALRTVGDVDIVAGQVYPTTLSQYQMLVDAANGQASSITIHGDGTSPQEPYSAGGSLSLQADNIVQGGVLRAPLGELVFNAGQSLSFEDGSLTSVAAHGLIPFGTVVNGRDWVYYFDSTHYMTLAADAQSSDSGVLAMPGKRIVSSAPSVAFKPGATLDLSGGGDLYASEFLPGPGGSKNVLANDGKTFAIIPGYQSAYAPVDPQNDAGSGLHAGERVWLAGGNGLAAGYYTLLPAQYALLPGAYSITTVAGGRDSSAGQGTAVNTLYQDGSLLMSGKTASGASGLGDSRWSTLLLLSGNVVRSYTEFGEYRASSFFTAQAKAQGIDRPTLPVDAGTLVVDVGNDLLLKGKFLLGATDGRRGNFDLAAQDLLIVGDESTPAASGTVKVKVADLQAMDVGSLLLGGRRDAAGVVTIKADSVTLANDANSELVAPDITLAAKNSVLVKENAVIKGSGATTAETLSLGGEGADADGALLRVTGLGLGEIIRNAPSGSRGSLEIRSGALVRGEGGVNLDATLESKLAQAPQIGSGGGFAFGTGKIALGDAVPANTYNVVFDSAALRDFDNLSRLTLSSYGGFDLYGTVNLGSAKMTRLALYGAGLQGYAANATLTAQTVVLANAGRNALTGSPPAGAGGKLAVQAGSFVFGSGLTRAASKAERQENHDFAVAGFAETRIAASAEVRGEGQGKGALRVENGQLVVAAPRITASGGAQAELAAIAGSLSTIQAGSSTAALPVGGSLTLSGTTISHAGTAIAASGAVRFAAVGDIELATGSVSSAAGQAVKLGSETVNTDGGSISLVSEHGAVIAKDGATLDVSGPVNGGSLEISAVDTTVQSVGSQNSTAGRFDLASGAILKGGGSNQQAAFTLDAGSLPGFGQLNSALNSAGFGESRQFRARSGDIQLASGESVVAHSIGIAADHGDVSIGGTLDARGASGGTIKVYAAQATAGEGKGNVTLAATARLLAQATTAATSSAGKSGDGGTVEIGTSTADGSMPGDKASGALLSIEDGAQIDVSGAGAGSGGRVVLRVPRIGSDEGQDVAITGHLNGLVKGASDVMIEAVKVYDGVSEIHAADVATTGSWYLETKKFIDDNKVNILDSLGNPLDVRLQPGLEIRSSGDMLVSVNETLGSTVAANRGWNLNTWRFAGAPISLSLRAADKLTIAGSLSDGFVKPSNNKLALPDWALDPAAGHSASYRLAAAADLAAANPLAVNARSDESGDFTLTFARASGSSADQPVALIRTGTGNIEVAAGHDVVLGSFETAQAEILAAQIYTAGRATSPSDYSAPSIALNTAYGAISTNKLSAAFPTGGGDVVIHAENDVQGVATSQLFTDWLFRQGQIKLDANGHTVFAGSGNKTYATSWWVQFDRFNQNLATFGGGDVRVTARLGSISNLSAAAVTTAYVAGSPGTALTEQGGGEVSIEAGRDIRGGAFYAQKGDVSLLAGGDITRGDRLLDYSDTNSGAIVQLSTLPIIGLGDGVAHVVARGDAGIESVLNPTLIPQVKENVASASFTSIGSSFSYFGTYGANSAFDLVSLNGNATLGNSINALLLVNRIASDSERSVDYLYKNSLYPLYTYYPGTVRVSALGGDVDVLAGFSMAPTAKGQLSLLAQGSVKANAALLGSDQPSIVMLDRDPLLMPTAIRPAGYDEFGPDAGLTGALGGSVQGLAYHTSGGLHTDDKLPVKVVAVEGDILGRADQPYTLVAAKAVDVQAGGDIKDFGLYAQHLAATDVSTIRAGGSITAPSEVDGSSPVTFRIGGPGRLEMLAGRNIDFGNSQGLVSAGNADNPYLPQVDDYGTNAVYSTRRYGADLLLAAGLAQGLKYEEFLYSLAPSSLSPTLTEAARQAVVEASGDGLFHRADGSLAAAPTADQVWASFKALPAEKRTAFYTAQVSNINDAFFAAVLAQVKAEPKNLAAFDQLIAHYIEPGGKSGDINVFGSQIKTLRRGNIDIFTPNGSLYAGVVSTPASLLAAKTAADLGIFTISGGEIRIFVGQDIAVNQGRIFSLGGGDISLVSQYQDISAGRGAKTAASAPPPTLEFDAFGNARIDISNSVAGSGIRTLKTGDDVPLASIYVASPRGTFDAGDAGVGSSGNVEIVAASVLNAGNITAGGTLSGAPTVDTSSLGGAVAAPTVQTSQAEDVARSAMGGSALNRLLTFLSVDVLGLGEEGESTTGQDEKKSKGRQ